MTTRHTFACIMLQNRADKKWIAKRMLGHTTTAMLDSVYGNYMPSNINKEQFNFLNAASSLLNHDQEIPKPCDLSAI